ncbi:T9SS type A sorting domain-containing protein [Chitinophagaceae bacterium MMS25-I14]
MNHPILQFPSTLWRRAGTVVLACLLAAPIHGQQRRPAPDATLKARADQWLHDDHTGFVENKGQIKDQNGKPNPGIKYLLNMQGLNVQLRSTGFSYDAYVLEKTGKKIVQPGRDGKDVMTDEIAQRFHRVDISLEGANPDAQLVAEKPLTAIENFMVNNGFAQVHSYKKVTYKNIYPGIDLEFVAKKGTDKPVEYNFIIQPGADASKIKMKYANGSDIALKDGKIKMQLAFGTLEEKIPASFTRQDGRSLAVQYKPLDEANNLYAFNVPAYDQSKTLVIDPTPSLVWATYVGGTGNDYVNGICTDPLANVYVVGSTSSTNNIATGGSVYQNTIGASTTAVFVAKYTAAGVKIWGTYFGATGSSASGSAIVSDGTAVYIGGSILTGNITGTVGQTTGGGVGDGLLLSLNTATGARNWSSYYGGTGGSDIINGLCVTSNGFLYAAGSTNSTSNIATNSTTLSGTQDAFLAKFTTAGVRQWGTYIGGAASDFGNSVDIDANDTPFVGGYVTIGTTTGIAVSGSPATQGQTSTGTTDAFIAKFNPATGARIWGRYFGDASNTTQLLDMKIDKVNGMLYATGGTRCTAGIATPGAFQTILGGNYDIFLGKFDISNGNLSWATYDGNALAVSSVCMALDASGNPVVMGYGGVASGESFYSTPCTYQPTAPVAGTSSYITKFNSSGNRLWGTYFGVNADTRGTGMAINSAGEMYLGYTMTAPATGIATAGAQQATLSAGGGDESGIAKFSEGNLPTDFAVAASTLTPMTQAACALGVPQPIVGNTVVATNPNNFTTGIFYQWQQSAAATGPWTDLAGETFKDLTPPTGSTSYFYRRLIKANNGYCDLAVVDSSAAASVTINGNVAPTANANGPKWYVCPAGTLTLNGSGTPVSPATISSYAWYVGSNTTAAAATANYTTSAISAATTFTLKVTDSKGCSALDQVTVTPVQANAGPDVSFCAGTNGTQIGTAPLSGITYAWTLISGTPAVATALSCTTCAQPVAKPTTTSSYKLTVTVPLKAGGTCTTVDTVIVTPVAAPNSNTTFGGTDKTICKNTTTTLGTTNDATFTYAWTPGTYLSNTAIFNPVFNAGTSAVACPMTFTVTAIKSGCAFEDQVNVSVIDADIDAGGQTFCGPGWVSGSGTNCTATYTWNLVSGPGMVVSTRNNGADAYLKNTGSAGGTAAVYNRTTTVNGVTCTSANVTVNNCVNGSGCGLISIKQLSAQGCPKAFTGQPLQLTVNGITTADYNISWTPASLVDNPTASVVNIVSASQATIKVTVTNKYDTSIHCSATMPINAPSWALPVVNLGDKNTCPGTAVAIGVTPVTGYSYTWTPAAGLSSVSIANPTATLSGTAGYTLLVKETATGCQVSKTMAVNVSSISFDAGPDRAVCNNGIATLGTAAGGSYTYSWTPANAAWQNGTGPTNANPQVLFAGADQTFIVTVTDPLTGCAKLDTVTLKGTVTAGSMAGIAAPPAICPGGSSQLGTAAQTGASYQWTPSTGLSSTMIANPVASPATTTLYTVAVSYPGCSTPATDTVRVIVKPTTAFDFVAKTVCPSTPTNIGVGGTGNPSSIANVASYSWSPATGLSCTSCASPNANPQLATIYTVVATFTNGCTLSDTVSIAPTFTASAKPDASVCPGATVVLGLPSVANVTYSWSPATSLSATNVAQPTFTAGVTGTYTLTATGTGANAGCTIVDAVKVTVNTPPAFTITGNPVICSGGNSTTLGFTPATANMLYQWTPTTGVSAPNSSSTLISPAGTQLYKLVQTDLATGCSNFQQVKVVVLPNTIAATGGNVNVCTNSGTVLPLTVTSTGVYSYSWAATPFLSNPYTKNPVTYANATTTYIATITDSASNCQLPVQSTVTVGVCAVSLSGNILHDANGQSDTTVNASGPVSGIPGNIYVSLVNASGKIIETVQVNTDGSYNFENISAGTYSIVITTDSAGSTTPVLPSGWSNTGANLGTGKGSTGATGILPNIVVGTTDVTNANLGIQQSPIPYPQTYVVVQPASQSLMPMTGTGSLNSPGPLSGFDNEDGTKGAGSTFTITDTTGMNGNELYYNGVKVVPGVPIPNYDPALLSVKFSGLGSYGLSFNYSVTDNAGVSSSSVPYSMSWVSPLPLHLLTFTATKNTDATALLSWTSVNDENTDQFVVERSRNASEWNAIGYVKAVRNSDGQKNYSLSDNKPWNGVNYYRLRINDVQGNYTLSTVTQLMFNMPGNAVTLAPNPSTGYTTLRFMQPVAHAVVVNVWNSAGQIVKTEQLKAGFQEYQLDMSNEVKGLYLISVNGDGVEEQIKLLLK